MVSEADKDVLRKRIVDLRRSIRMAEGPGAPGMKLRYGREAEAYGRILQALEES